MSHRFGGVEDGGYGFQEHRGVEVTEGVHAVLAGFGARLTRLPLRDCPSRSQRPLPNRGGGLW